jgi:hypothetical protein
VFLTGGALAVLASAPAAVFAVAGRRDWTTRSFYDRCAPLRLGTIFTALATVPFVDAMVGGVFGQNDFAENPLGLLVWVDFWVGLGVVCSLVGNVWDYVSP